MKTLFFRCKVCGNVIVKVIDSGAIPSCCNEQMESLNPNLIEKGQEKHVPVATFINENELCVKIGSKPHPMLSEHHIEFIAVETEKNLHLTWLDEKPEAKILIGTEKPKAIFEFCNIHGLWQTSTFFSNEQQNHIFNFFF